MTEAPNAAELYERMVAAPRRKAIVRDLFNEHLAVRTKPRTGLVALFRATASRRAYPAFLYGAPA